ncbi:MAG: hypothetical protein JKY31_13630 [Rhodobacteraceae bacterium]|nr:hypothetical protein [Paracoccaceae bacterium]
MAPANFIILYFSREGSTALVNMLSRQPGIRVPLMEQLDHYIFEKTDDITTPLQDMDAIYSTGIYDRIDTPMVQMRNLTVDDNFQSVGFKWRFWSDPVALSALFKKHNVTVFFLVRRNFLESVCSGYLQRFGPDLSPESDLTAHPQFKAAYLLGDDKQSFLKKIRQLRFPLNLNDFWFTADVKLRERNAHAHLAAVFTQNKIAIRPIYYEDFCDNPRNFLQDFMEEIHLPIPEKIDTYCDFIRVHNTPISRKLNGIWKVKWPTFSGFRFYRLKRQYRKKLAHMESLAAQQKQKNQT